jgi:hypothetical protein
MGKEGLLAMPTTTAQAFDSVGLRRKGIVNWGTKPKESTPGVYVVSLTKSLDAYDGVMSEAPLAESAFKQWCRVRSELRLDGKRPTVRRLMDRIRHFWIPDEVILYIGLADSLSERLGDYYRTPIGARRPHSGGYFVKLLSNLDQLWVHYAECSDPTGAENGMLRRFCENVSEDSKRDLLDPTHPFPFANLEWPKGVRKAHGIRGARERRTKTNPKGRSAQKERPLVRSSAAQDGAPYATRGATAIDLREGRIRIPSRSTSLARTLLPSEKATLDIKLKGHLLPASWDPRTGGDHQRSGVLRVGHVLGGLVREGETLLVSITEEGVICLD